MASLSRSVLVVFIAMCLPACGGSKLIKEPEPLVLTKPLAQASDQQLEVILDWVIVRAGSGSWAKNADWDEYLLRVRNLTDVEMQITGFAVYDALDVQMASSENRKELVKESRAVKKRFKGEGIKVKAGIGGNTLMMTGGAAGAAGVTVGMAALGGSTTATTFAGAAVVGIVAAPVLVIGGVVRAVNTNRVEKEILKRTTYRPVILEAGEEKSLDIFFPIAPSPKQVELTFIGTAGEKSVFIDISEALKGLHLPGETEPPKADQGEKPN